MRNSKHYQITSNYMGYRRYEDANGFSYRSYIKMNGDAKYSKKRWENGNKEIRFHENNRLVILNVESAICKQLRVHGEYSDRIGLETLSAMTEVIHEKYEVSSTGQIFLKEFPDRVIEPTHETSYLIEDELINGVMLYGFSLFVDANCMKNVVGVNLKDEFLKSWLAGERKPIEKEDFILTFG